MLDTRRWSPRFWSIYPKLELALLDGLREEHDRLGAPNLEDRRLERIDLAIWPKLHRAEEGHNVHLRQLVAYFFAIQRTGALDRDLEQRPANRSRRLPVVRLALVFVLEQFHEIAGGSENVLAGILFSGMPPRSAGNILRALPGGFDEILIGRSGNHRHHRRLHLLINHLLADQQEIVDVTGDEYPLRRQRLHLRQGRRVI